MSDLVRVRLPNGHETNMGRVHAEVSGLEILDEPTHRGDGTTRPATRRNSRPMKPRTSVSQEAEKKKKNRGATEAASNAEEATA